MQGNIKYIKTKKPIIKLFIRLKSIWKYGVPNENICLHFRRSSQQYKTDDWRTYFRRYRNRYYQSPLPGMAIVLLFSLPTLWSIWTKETVCVCNDKILDVKQCITKDSRARLWLCAAAEVSLTEQKKTGDSVLLFVASSTASQLINSKQSNYINFPQKEKTNNL